MILGIIYDLITVIFYSFFCLFKWLFYGHSFLYNKRELYKYRCNKAKFSQRRFIVKNGGKGAAQM